MKSLLLVCISWSVFSTYQCNHYKIQRINQEEKVQAYMALNTVIIQDYHAYIETSDSIIRLKNIAPKPIIKYVYALDTTLSGIGFNFSKIYFNSDTFFSDPLNRSRISPDNYNIYFKGVTQLDNLFFDTFSIPNKLRLLLKDKGTNYNIILVSDSQYVSALDPIHLTLKKKRFKVYIEVINEYGGIYGMSKEY